MLIFVLSVTTYCLKIYFWEFMNVLLFPNSNIKNQYLILQYFDGFLIVFDFFAQLLYLLSHLNFFSFGFLIPYYSSHQILEIFFKSTVFPI